ncbi:hypothetical protein [Pararhizobium sp.]|uniref:hypothetical protein n=1 Tax=Pararhizobium sp. TaxID=1977563 RepID=UPI002728DDF0|nr:hypothetical protein [Pararhizobium sp.]MDO9418283.1 hypothetical protein [Pararhizobium sp.]
MHYNRRPAARAIAIARADEAAAARIKLLRIMAIGVSALAALIALPFFKLI